MTPIVQIAKEFIGLVRKLRRFSLTETTKFVSGLSLCPELYANTIRLEVLQHLVAISCVGDKKPDREDLVDWLGQKMTDSSVAQMEDPVEDVFVGCVNSEFGSFRVFGGLVADADFWAERLLCFLADKQDFPPLEGVVQTALLPLKISEALAERVKLPRYTAGGGQDKQKISLPQWRTILNCAGAVQFSDADLASLGIDPNSLSPFILGDERKARITEEELGNSSFERYPLIRIADGLIVTSPSSLVCAVIRFLIERIKEGLGGWGDMFFRTEMSSIFVNEVRTRLGIEALNFHPPPWPDGLPAMLPMFGQLEYGKPVIMLTRCTPLSTSAFNTVESLSDDGALRGYLQACASEFEKWPGFSGGLILIALADITSNFVVGLNDDLPNWRMHVASLPDWLILTALEECSAMRLWKLGEHEAILYDHKIKTINVSGLVNFYAFWKENGFRLIPQAKDPRMLSLLIIQSDFAAAFRLEVKRLRDVHCVRSHDRGRWIKLTRQNSRPLFKEDSEILLYLDLESAGGGQLVGCVKKAKTNWWVTSPGRQENPELTHLVFQLWECVEAWVARVASSIEHRWPKFTIASVDIQLNLPELETWRSANRTNFKAATQQVSVSVNHEIVQIVLTLPEGFLPKFGTPKNVAEADIVLALIKGAADLSGKILSDEEFSQLTQEILQNDDARFFHVVEARGIEQMVTFAGRSKPLFIAEEDFSFVQQGLADLVGRPAGSTEIVGLDECKTFLKETVTKVWERIETRLKPFSRETVVHGCFNALDEIARDEKRWDMTSRSQFATHRDKGDVHEVLLDRRADRGKAALCNRLIIETAQYACSGGGRIFCEADHLTILADMTLLIVLANHRDAIAYGFMKPRLHILPNGELQIDEKFYADILGEYLTKRGRRVSEDAASDYDSYFPWIEKAKTENSRESDKILGNFDKVFVPEFGFGIRLLYRALDEFRELAVKSDLARNNVTEDLMKMVLEISGFTESQAAAFMDRFTLPIRSAWDQNLPKRCHSYDVYPWRFRRQLSLNVRPFVEMGTSPRTWLISVPVFEKSVSYWLQHLEVARFPKEFFHSKEMHSYIGNITNKLGHAFAEKVGKFFSDSGYSTKLEVEVTQLGAPKKLGLGDVDVLSWSQTTGKVYIIECKRLLTANSVREVVQRLEDFRGDKENRDSLGRHLRRIDWLRKNAQKLGEITGIPCENLHQTPLLVTSEIVPMQFFKEMNFPVSQVLTFDELGDAINSGRQ